MASPPRIRRPRQPHWRAPALPRERCAAGREWGRPSATTLRPIPASVWRVARAAGYGLLLDIRNPAQPVRIGAVVDTNMAAWHSVTFNNDGTKVIFSDEWGGGAQPRCRATDKHEWGADAIYTIADGKMTFQSYYKMSAPQTPEENCVAHNGSLIPIPGRDIMVQAWYQGGISVFEWTDPAHPREIAFFDRGPMDATKLIAAGYWSAYWYNGYIVGSEDARGVDLFELKPSGFISQNEIDAAKLVRFDFENVQGQPKFVWPASFVVARAYVDQLVRDHGVAPDVSSSHLAVIGGGREAIRPAAECLVDGAGHPTGRRRARRCGRGQSAVVGRRGQTAGRQLRASALVAPVGRGQSADWSPLHEIHLSHVMGSAMRSNFSSWRPCARSRAPISRSWPPSVRCQRSPVRTRVLQGPGAGRHRQVICR